MKFSVQRANLLNAVKNALKVVDKNAVIEETRGVYIDADADNGIISVIGTDVQSQLQCRIADGHIEHGGQVVIRPIVAEMLALMDGDIVTLELCDVQRLLNISCGTCQYSVPYMDAKAFPKMQLPFPEDTVCVKGINPLIKRTAFAAQDKTDDINRKALQFIKITFSSCLAQAEATNGDCGAVAVSRSCADGKLSLIIHKKALQILNGLIKNQSEEMYVGISGKFAVFMKKDMFFFTMKHSGGYIESSRFIQLIKPKFRAVLDGRDLYGLTDNVSAIFGAGDDDCINLIIDKDRIIMSTKTAIASCQNSIPSDSNIPTPKDGFNYSARILSEVFRNASGMVTLKLDEKGFLLLETGDNRYFVGARAPVKIKLKEEKPKKKTKTKKETASAAA